MQHFFVKLIPPRPIFADDMTNGERGLMIQHVERCQEHFDVGMVVVYGPVLAPSGSFGMAVMEAEQEADVRRIMEDDPSVKAGMNSFEIYPMRVGNARGLSGTDRSTASAQA